jgi:ABC-type multidrug transport system ATPase subunit
MGAALSFRDVHKRFENTRILTGFSADFYAGRAYHIAGPNGSGKSTFLKLACGYLSPDKGSVSFSENGKPAGPDAWASSTAFCAPYIDLLEELTGREQLAFHRKFTSVLETSHWDQALEASGLTSSLDKPIRLYSSGMKQRLKLILAFMSEAPLLLLDEPCSNLDEPGRLFYASLARRYASERLVLVASNNMREEHFFCGEVIYPSGDNAQV